MSGRIAGVLLAAALAVVAGCSAGPESAPDATSAQASRPTSATPAPAGTRTTGRATAERTTSTLGPFPPVLESGPSGVDSSAIRSPGDLAGAFQCPSTVAPITIPATAEAPEALVCASRLAGDEALFLWYAGDPDQRYRALRAALAKAKYVRGGPNWVAGSMLDPAMGDVGGEVYK